MDRKQIHFFSAVCLLLASVLPLSGQERALSVGGRNGWNALSYSKNITTGTGRFGYAALQLMANAGKPDAYTDMLVSFERTPVTDNTGTYEVVSSSLLSTEKTRFGKSAGLSRDAGNGLVMKGGTGSLFGTVGPAGSFTIEFWLLPSLAENGETVFSWRSSKNISNMPVYQTISASFSGNRLSWSFINVFAGETTPESSIVLSSYNAVIPGEWAHHMISYNENMARIEYYIDSSLEAVVYVTDNGRESGARMEPFFGIPAAISWCPRFTGCIDEIRIARRAQEQQRYARFSADGGRFETMPVETAGIGSVLTEISSVVQLPPQTGIQLFARGGDNVHEWIDAPPPWIPVSLNGKVSGVSGRYFQLAAELYPDGLGNSTPAVTEIILHYTEKQPPVPPFSVQAVPGDGSVTVTWSVAADSGTGGYLLYYGEYPGEYLGQIAVEGVSPVDTGNVQSYTLSGLVNGKIYYFAVSAYDEHNKNVSGGLSREVYARPLPGETRR